MPDGGKQVQNRRSENGLPESTGQVYIVLNRANKNMFQNVIETGLDSFFPKRTVKLHDKDKPWVTLEYKNLIAKRQRAFIRGDHSLYCM